MGHIVKTPAGTYRANWRDAAGRQKAKSFRTKREASAFLAETEASLTRGSYVDPSASRTKFSAYADRWLSSRSVEATTLAAWSSRLRSRLLPHWGGWQLGKIDHLAVQEWVTEVGKQLAPATVASCFGLFSSIMASAVRNRLIAFNPCEGVRLPAQRKRAGAVHTISQADLTARLLPAVPEWHRALVAVAAGAGLRWGECLGLRWGCVDLNASTLTVERVVIEVDGHLFDKPYPKSTSSRRTVPLAPFLEHALRRHRELVGHRPDDRVFINYEGGSMLRSNFRRQVWRPSLVRAGLLGEVVILGESRFRAVWPDRMGEEHSAEYATHREAVAEVAAKAAGGLRFHDLRHCYATWLVSGGVPINVVQAVMGHEQASTTLNRYTHTPADFYGPVRKVFGSSADDLLTLNGDPQSGKEPIEGEESL
ncbi:tyrosine-type recombinase/integrase [Micromonospora sp. SL4-19]|uniref:tyrosine-type recombinase/integrase n=1 Tax=Micromonospora sp. SL4-19 TaxID=3399129 RepID=UPI003A4DDD5A